MSRKLSKIAATARGTVFVIRAPPLLKLRSYIVTKPISSLSSGGVGPWKNEEFY
jgi:hypothetical protein